MENEPISTCLKNNKQRLSICAKGTKEIHLEREFGQPLLLSDIKDISQNGNVK